MKLELSNKEKLGEVGGLYCHGIKAGSFIFTTQIGNIKGEKLIGPGIYEQTVQCLHNVSHLLETIGADLTNIVKCTIYILNMDEYQELNKAYKEIMPKPYPARACIEVSKLSPGSVVEMEVIAYVK